MGINPFNHKLKFIEQCNHVTIQTYFIYTLRYIRIRSIQLTYNIIYSFQQAKQSVENDTVYDYVQESMWQLLTIFERLNKPEKCVFLIVSKPGNKLVTCNVHNLSNPQIYSACTHCDKQCILVLSFVSMYSYTKINRKKSFGHKIHNPAYLDSQQNGNVIKKAWNCHLTHWHWEDNWLFIAERHHSMQVNYTVDNGNSRIHCFGWHQTARSALDQMAPATWSVSQAKISQKVKAAQTKNFIFVKGIVNCFKYN